MRRIAFGAVLGMFLAAPVVAQDRRVEVGANAGLTFSDGVTFNGVVAPGDGAIYDSIGPIDSFSWGLDLGYFVNESVEIGFLFSQQKSELEVGGTRAVVVGSQSVDNYHGYVAWHGGTADSGVRPYFLLGLGATHYGKVPFTGLGGQSRETLGNSQFSPTFGLGLKLYTQGAFGVKLGARWTPTYIKSDSDGWWCDPYWGCYVVTDPQYSNQFELSGGIVLRF
jgi:hypothetical protein